MTDQPALPTPPDLPRTTSAVWLGGERWTSLEFSKLLAEIPDGSMVDLGDSVIDANEGPVILMGRKDLLFIGGTVIQTTTGENVAPKTWAPRLELDWPRNRCSWMPIECERISWVRPTVTGPAPAGVYPGQKFEEQAAFSLRRSSDITIFDAAVGGVLGDAVTVIHDGGSSSREGCRRVEVVGLSALSIGRNVVAVVAGEDITVSGVRALGVGRSAFNVEPAAATNRVRRVLVENGSVAELRGALIGNLGSRSNDVTDLTFCDLRTADAPLKVTMAGGHLDPGRRRQRVLLERLSGHGPSVANGVVMSITDYDHVTVRDIDQRCAGERAATNYPGIGARFTRIDHLHLERLGFVKGESAKPTGDLAPWVEIDCTNVEASA